MLAGIAIQQGVGVVAAFDDAAETGGSWSCKEHEAHEPWSTGIAGCCSVPTVLRCHRCEVKCMESECRKAPASAPSSASSHVAIFRRPFEELAESLSREEL
mmetsp:Transcript_85336/g.135250  ORF Transcript_85336/g.135250 Transcript_85336/m.135250 type:complete len:101 (+) Transcript_85336:217-519(+)